jgi:hypothetical protein
MLRRVQIPYLDQEGYVNLRCVWTLGCPSEIKPLIEANRQRDPQEEVRTGDVYEQAFTELFPSTPVPEVVGVSCCAQFAVTRSQIQRRKKKDYERYRDWLLSTPLKDSISGRVLEYSWHSASSRSDFLFARLFPAADCSQ